MRHGGMQTVKSSTCCGKMRSVAHPLNIIHRKPYRAVWAVKWEMPILYIFFVPGTCFMSLGGHSRPCDWHQKQLDQKNVSFHCAQTVWKVSSGDSRCSTSNTSQAEYSEAFELSSFYIPSFILCGWIAGHESEYMESLPEEEFKQRVTELIHQFTGECLRRSGLANLYHVLHWWRLWEQVIRFFFIIKRDVSKEGCLDGQKPLRKSFVFYVI